MDWFASLPDWYLKSFAILFGLIVGSFTNVLVARLPHGKKIHYPPSACVKCGTKIRWSDNVPVLSYLLLKGKCRSCKEPISVRYPIIELLSAFLYLAAELRLGMSWELLLRDWPLITMLVAITFIDLEHRIIPDELSLGGLAWGLVTSPLSRSPGWLQSILGAAIGFGVFYGMAWIYRWRRGRMGLGGGDIKLLAMLGAFLGPMGVFSVILISSISGSLIGIAWALLQRRRNPEAGLMTAAIPYGPFLVIGALYYQLIVLPAGGGGAWLPFMTLM